MARTKERVCLSLPISLCERLRTSYPHTDFSELIRQLLEYADAAGFLKRLKDIDPADYDTPKDKKAAARQLKEMKQAVNAVVSSVDTIEEFGA